MRRWEYAEMALIKGLGEVDYVAFSHPQQPGAVQFAKDRLDRGIKEGQSHEKFWHLNLSWSGEVAMSVLAVLGDMGWEMVGQSIDHAGHAYYSLKRELPPA